MAKKSTPQPINTTLNKTYDVFKSLLENAINEGKAIKNKLSNHHVSPFDIPLIESDYNKWNTKTSTMLRYAFNIENNRYYRSFIMVNVNQHFMGKSEHQLLFEKIDNSLDDLEALFVSYEHIPVILPDGADLDHKSIPSEFNNNRGNIVLNYGNNNSITTNYTQIQVSQAKELIDRIKKENEKINAERESDLNEIAEVILDIEDKINTDKKIQNYSWKFLLDTTSKFSTIFNFTLSLAKLFGYNPVPA